MGIVAYLDAGSTSMFVGAVAAAGAGVAVAAKVGWRRVAGAFSPKKSSLEPQDSTVATTNTGDIEPAPGDDA